MLYRPYKPDDFAELYRVEEACFEPPFRFDLGYMRQIVSSDHGAAWVAEQSGLLAGFAIAKFSKSRRLRSAYIETIEVLPEHRRSGIAAALMRRLEDSAINAGAALIWLHVDTENVAAIHLYETNGYLSNGIVRNYYPRDRDALIYRKSLLDNVG